MYKTYQKRLTKPASLFYIVFIIRAIDYLSMTIFLTIDLPSSTTFRW